ncbi:MAG TPA: hypothetical protein VGL94_02605 [Ktedonobacteraceae bacterium]
MPSKNPFQPRNENFKTIHDLKDEQTIKAGNEHKVIDVVRKQVEPLDKGKKLSNESQGEKLNSEELRQKRLKALEQNPQQHTPADRQAYLNLLQSPYMTTASSQLSDATTEQSSNQSLEASSSDASNSSKQQGLSQIEIKRIKDIKANIERINNQDPKNDTQEDSIKRHMLETREALIERRKQAIKDKKLSEAYLEEKCR